MAKKSSAKKNFFASLTALAVSATMMVGSTFAWFTDEVKSGRNTIAAGNLDVELSYYVGGNDPWTPVTTETKLFNDNARWEPGYTEVVYLQVENEGSLDVKYLFTLDQESEVKGKNKAGAFFALSDYLKFGYVDVEDIAEDKFTSNEAAINAVEDNAYTLSEAYNHTLQGTILNGGAAKTFAVVVWMPSNVGNVANAQKENPASIQLGVSLFATQMASEADDFGTDFDKDAPLPVLATKKIKIDYALVAQTISVEDADGAKVATMEIPNSALAAGATELVITVEETSEVDDEYAVVIGEDQTSRIFNIDVEGLQENNDVPVQVQLDIGAGLGDNVKLYHKGALIDSNYHNDTGLLWFNTTNFSPFEVVYDKEPVVTPDETPDVTPDEGELPEGFPTASVNRSCKYENADLPWGKYGAWSPTEGLDSKLEAAYTFAVTESKEEAQQNPYANWHCDFYVMLDKDLGENQIFLGGNYGAFGWVGFHNGDLTLDANTEIPLLGSVTSNPWTYLDVVQNVGEFICGVGDVNDALAGATFTVMLRLTNPNDATEYYNVATINYTFKDNLPTASVVNSTEYENVELAWGSYGQWSPTQGLDSQLEAAYTFTAVEAEQVDDSPYKDWYCDFYVSLDKDLGENEIFLGGNYGSFGWVGFHNGDLTLEANTEIALLGSVTDNPWTYLDVVQNVKEFICGVGDVNNALSGATFTVMLRLTNPEDETEFYNVATINYTFA